MVFFNSVYVLLSINEFHQWWRMKAKFEQWTQECLINIEKCDRRRICGWILNEWTTKIENIENGERRLKRQWIEYVAKRIDVKYIKEMITLTMVIIWSKKIYSHSIYVCMYTFNMCHESLHHFILAY